MSYSKSEFLNDLTGAISDLLHYQIVDADEKYGHIKQKLRQVIIRKNMNYLQKKYDQGYKDHCVGHICTFHAGRRPFERSFWQKIVSEDVSLEKQSYNWMFENTVQLVRDDMVKWVRDRPQTVIIITVASLYFAWNHPYLFFGLGSLAAAGYSISLLLD